MDQFPCLVKRMILENYRVQLGKRIHQEKLNKLNQEYLQICAFNDRDNYLEVVNLTIPDSLGIKEIYNFRYRGCLNPYYEENYEIRNSFFKQNKVVKIPKNYL